jgi:pimeloyl-ACP methyl ester carboxylesterase
MGVDDHGMPIAPAGSRDADLPLILLPGTLCDERLFGPLMAELDGQAFEVLPIDGGSSAAEVAAILLAGAPPRFRLLGFSLGGMVALEMVRQAPRRVAGLALVSSNARAIAAEDRAARRAPYRLADDEPVENIIERLWPRYVAPAALHDAGLFRLVKDMAAGCSRASLARQIEIMLSRAASLALLPTLSMPCLILAGAEDALCPPAMQAEMAAALPDARLVSIEGVGHLLPLEAPAIAAHHIAQWLMEMADMG